LIALPFSSFRGRNDLPRYPSRQEIDGCIFRENRERFKGFVRNDQQAFHGTAVAQSLRRQVSLPA